MTVMVQLILILVLALLACVGIAGIFALPNAILKFLSFVLATVCLGILFVGFGIGKLLIGGLEQSVSAVGGIEGLLFWVFAILTCGGAIAVVATQNVVRMAFWLVVSLGSVAALFFLLHADFLGAAQLLIYVGGTVVLLVFGVMLTASGHTVRIQTSSAETLLGGGVGVILLCVLLFATTTVDWVDVSTQISKSGDSPAAMDDREIQRLSDLSAQATTPEEKKVAEDAKAAAIARRQAGRTLRPLGLSFYGLRPDRNLNQAPGQPLAPGFLLPFEIISIHLLVVLIGAAYLARAKRRVVPGTADL